MNESISKLFRRGLWTFLALLALTIVEFILAFVLNGSTIPLFLIALVKAALIVWVFMHIYRLWREENH